MQLFRKTYLFFVILFFSFTAFAQNYEVSGVVKDFATNIPLKGVLIQVKDHPWAGATTDNDGKYSINLPKGNYTLVAEYMGYEEMEAKIALTSRNVSENFELSEKLIQLSEAIVSAKRPDQSVTNPQTGVEQIEVKQINKLPVLLGERDIIKSLQLMPGVKSAGEGSTGLYVRGGTSDQNLVMLDNVQVYNASHLMGFFSAFNSDVLRDVTLYKGSMPAQYGERLSAILDVQQRNGDLQQYHVSGGVGLISSKLNIEGPIKKGKSSFLLGGRRTYADALGRMLGIKDLKDNTLYFYDLNAKLYFNLSDKDQLSISGYMGRDKMSLKDFASVDWGNLLGAVKWRHTIDDKWSSTSTLFYNQYSYNFNLDLGLSITGKAIIKDYGVKQEFLFEPNANQSLRLGFQSTYHDIGPGDYDLVSDSQSSINLHHRYSWENGVYASHQIQIGNKLELIYGLRLSVFSALGKGEYYQLDDNNNVLDSIWYKKGEFVKTYVNLEPRLSSVYKINEVSSIKAAYARTIQNMHLLTFAAQGTPYDRWISSSNNIKPQIGDQYTLGYFRNFADNTYEFSVEGYYKDMQNQIDFKDNPRFDGYNVVETELLYGKGRAYGVELMLKKRVGKLSGWISYTLSKSERRIDGINNNQWYNAYQDRTHDISIVGIYELNKRWTLSATWVYYTGNAITYPSGKYQIDGQDVMYYTERNGYRAPAYHRLDLGAVYSLKKTAKFESELAFSLYNAYGRQNAYIIQFKTNNDDPTKTSAYQYSLFSFVPSISWNFKF